MKLLVLSDSAVPSGYGRIVDSVMMRLARRGYDVFAASIAYDGLLPPNYENDRLPYWVAALAGKDWLGETVKLISVVQPDVVMVVQDAPYGMQVRNAPIDWSNTAFVVCHPVDGAPVYKPWANLVRDADGALTISQFGVDTYRAQGVQASLLAPGVDGNKFFRASTDERTAWRIALGIVPDAFVLGTAAQNQGRKAISMMLKAFFAFAVDKPNARYLLDMDAISQAGWDILGLCDMYGWDKSKLIFRADAMRAGLTDLRQRYNVMDAHMVISHREGFGLPLIEAQACGVACLALDYCSGPEICGDGKGVLVKALPYREIGTWGGSEDCFPDMDDLVKKLRRLHDDPIKRAAIAERGMKAARARSWDAAADAVDSVLKAALAKRRPLAQVG